MFILFLHTNECPSGVGKAVAGAMFFSRGEGTSKRRGNYQDPNRRGRPGSPVYSAPDLPTFGKRHLRRGD